MVLEVIGAVDGDKSLFQTAMNSYNTAIATLNSKAGDYLNTTYASGARCIGSVPNNPASEGEYGPPTFHDAIECKLGDENYVIDLAQLTKLQILEIGKPYWLASRYYNASVAWGGFGALVRSIDEGGQLNLQHSYVLGDGQHRTDFSSSLTKGLRPVFTLKSDLQITEGEGTQSSPYVLST